jgi:hypothetical protein
MDDWKTKVVEYIGINFFFLSNLGTIVGAINSDANGPFIQNPRMVVQTPEGKQGLAALPGHPDKLHLLEKPLYIWPLKYKPTLDNYIKQTTGLVLVDNVPSGALKQ